MIASILAATLISQTPAEISNQEVFAGDDKDKRYFLIGPIKKTEKAPLLLVMPGGDGSADFNPFVSRIPSALPNEFVLAQLIAPKWSEEQFSRIVWPTSKNSWTGMKFSTDDFVAAVVKDVSSRHSIDPARVYALCWSSSGPAVWTISLSAKSPLKGAFVAMSIFNEGLVPERAAAKGKRFYILHSPEDFIPISQAEAARDRVKALGGTVEYQTYAGGHGWHGDVFGMIRTGVDWLERRE